MLTRILAGAVCAGAMLCAGQAAAIEITQCASGCVTGAQGFPSAVFVDYTIPSDGQAYRWDLWTDNAHPDALINLGSPNETFSLLQVSNGDGTFTQTTDFPPFSSITWNEIQTPGHTSIYVKSPVVDFNNCSSSTPAGVTCAAKNNIGGNGVLITVNAPDPVKIFFSSAAVPEPASWAMMLTGFFGLGAMLRRGRPATT